MIPRPDLLHPDSPPGLEVFQLTTETDVPGSHIYMEAQIFTPDSKRLILHRAAHAHGPIPDDPRHQYLLCDLDSECALTPLTDELNTTGPSVSPDGEFLYYFVDETVVNGGWFTLKRVRLDGTDRETILVQEGPLPGSHRRLSRLYPLSTISSDGQRVAISGFLGDRKTPHDAWGLIVCDVPSGTVRLILEGPSWCNVHPQYCRSTDPQAAHDLLVQENHDHRADAQGQVTLLVGGNGADIHVIRDDGTNFRNMPWGRDGNEFCQGHQCWRGRDTWAITSTGTRQPPEAQLIEGKAAPYAGHVGIATPGGVRNDLSRDFDGPDFYHFATDIAGRRLITDSGPQGGGGGLWLAEFGEAGVAALQGWTFLLNPRCSWQKGAHIHPFLSPDGTMGFFNSDESGQLQAYMVRGF
ncbi:MAG: hypothetical protein HPY69_15875 [Armatimonadetes bacterium]|nr:hypothetical protein [Armatimonadota bacterium]